MSEPLLVLRTREELAGLVAGRPPGPLALVPTMGALHAGHEALVRHAAGLAPTTVVSVFVNPTQFAPGEDFDRYPRTFDADLERAAAAGATAVLAPEVSTVYPGWPEAETVSVDPGPLGSVLEGASRPTHFRGVLTVVAKLFGLVRPDVAVFGEKDYQQLVLVRRMAATLCLGVDVVGVPTVREDDGLALSSRNRYLVADDRRRAVALVRALRAGAEAAGGGHAAVLAAARDVLADAEGVETDYLALTDADLGEPDENREGRLLVAARLGGTRLIDNVAVQAARGRPASPVRMGA